MGVKFKISSSLLPKEFQHLPLIATDDGISDTVYLLGDKYVLKIYDKKSDEEKILDLLSSLPVPKVIKSFFIDKKYALITTQINGISTNSYPLEVVKFLKSMHKITKSKKTKNPKIYTIQMLENMLKSADQKLFFDLYHDIDLQLNDDGIIHGDLFPDNAKFVNQKLSGVFDFSEACVGDFYFDLAVVTFSFDVDVKDVLKVYEANISYKKFLEYIKFAKLYYALSRYLHGKKDYRSLL